MKSRWLSKIRIPTLRRRVSAWTVAILASTVILFSAADVWQTRRTLARNDTAHAVALLAHLVQMPEFGSDSRTASRAVAALQQTIRGGEIRLRSVTGGGGTNGRPAASRRVRLTDGEFLLEYAVPPERGRSLVRRSIVMHSMHVILAMAAVVAVTEWLLRRRLVRPLARIAQQMRHVRRGGGWIPSLPAVDQELAALTAAFNDLAPELQRQMTEWIDVEKRATAALVFSRLEQRLMRESAGGRLLPAHIQEIVDAERNATLAELGVRRSVRKGENR